ncbi:unnamed protein product [Didymodactylos carnosus]|uniref:Tetratricopeptide repeat protein n=1 Tax=Didymodactylos carnosus TaxID=1234261 RepID=A0A815TLZ1_9BILA|nr:unnamed protein product [Didymodactylos carnosus]CAF1504840.1 unnamed protein product [Didymodactylos carnosus]CAF4067360.1 unnamed protein product [Didymodactylos carnosus]CAF4366172.1 unnamed protein product [Didymodactylos carnosus]
MDRLWQVELTLTSDNDKQLNALTTQIHTELFSQTTAWARLAELLIILGEFDKADELYRILIRQEPTAIEKSKICARLAWIKRSQGQNSEAMSFIKKS